MIVDDLPVDVRALADRFVEGLEEALGPKFAGLFLYGSVCFPPSWVADFDFHVLLTEPLTDSERASTTALHGALEALPLGDEMDGYYVTLQDAARRERPVHQRKLEMVDSSWALHRAHVHAGRYVLVRGVDPRDIVPKPEWPELDEALQGELEYVEDHLADAPSRSSSTT